MRKKSPEQLAKLHCLHSLFELEEEADPDLATHLQTAIEFSLREEAIAPDAGEVENFAYLAKMLVEEQAHYTPSYGVYVLDLRGRCYDELWVRLEVIGGLKQLAGYARSLLMVRGLREAVLQGGRGKYFSKRRRAQHAAARSYIDELAAAWTARGCALTILYV